MLLPGVSASTIRLEDTESTLSGREGCGFCVFQRARSDLRILKAGTSRPIFRTRCVSASTIRLEDTERFEVMETDTCHFVFQRARSDLRILKGLVAGLVAVVGVGFSEHDPT